MKKPLIGLYLISIFTVILAFTSFYALHLRLYILSILIIFLCWFINKYYYVCPNCGAKLNERVHLNNDSICGKCKTYISTGEKVKKSTIYSQRRQTKNNG